MKKILAIVLLLAAAFCACGEEMKPEEKAVPLYEMLLSSCYFESFEEAPGALLALQVIGMYREYAATAGEALTDEEIYGMLFSGGVYEEAQEEAENWTDPVRVTIESAIESGIGTIIVSVKSEKDYGYGFEFDMYADFHILPDENAPFGARIARVFIPE